MKLKFVSDAYYNEKHVFEKGKTYEVNDDLGYASRWIRRGVAVKVEGDEVTSPDEPKQVIEQTEVPKQDITGMTRNNKKQKNSYKKSVGHEAL
jgi:hypothetical protein